VKPGLTGLWQITGRSDMSFAEMEEWDTYYVRNWSIWLDAIVLARTFIAVFSTKGAY
jgi:lipopolysaccharide/colanic/teichoic acid biosynthesis glycosyltransferase